MRSSLYQRSKRQVLGHAVTAVDLHRPVNDATRCLGCVDLCHRRLETEGLAVVELLRRREAEPAGRANIDLVVDQHPLDGLPVGERLAEGHAVA